MDYHTLFNAIHLDFFKRENICNLPKEEIYTELIFDLHKDLKKTPFSQYPNNITFGEFNGNINLVKSAVATVKEDWVQYFNEDKRIFCVFDGNKIVSFCILNDQWTHRGIHVAGPACVGTIPEYR